jgi:flagellar motor switch/type III secretory pathway protein FliN
MAESAAAAPEGTGGVIARKLAVARDGGGAVANSLILKTLRRSLARAAKELCELPLAVLAARQSNRKPEDLESLLSDDQLLIVLDGPDGRLGAVSLDAPAVTALIQKQTIGVVMGLPGGTRNYTATDAAMCAEFIDDSFGKVTAMLDGHSDKLSFEGYRFGARIADVRSLLLALEAETYRSFELTLDLDGGKLQGKMGIILPDPSTFARNGADDAGLAGLSLGSNMGVMRAELTAVLCRMSLPVSEFTSLQQGDVIPLDQAFLYETDLVAINGQVMATGRLGQLNGARAVRMNQTQMDTGAEEGAFASHTGAELPPPDMGGVPALGMEIAANTLQDPLDGLPPVDLPDPGGLAMDESASIDMDALGSLPPLDGGEAGAAEDMGELLGTGMDGGLDSFDPDEALAEISELAGLGDALPDAS